MSGRKMLAGALGLIPCYVIFHLFRNKISKDIQNTEFYIEAMEALKHHKGAVYLLGQPITETRAKYNSSFLNSENVEVKVYISGPKSKGILFYSLLPDEGPGKLNTVQLQIGSDDSKRLVIR